MFRFRRTREPMASSPTSRRAPEGLLEAPWERNSPSTVNPIDVAVVLYSANVTNFEYAFPRWQVPRQNLRPEWTAVNGAFADFLSPPFVSYDVTLDPARTYRLGLLISAERPEPVHGHIDVDDLRFE